MQPVKIGLVQAVGRGIRLRCPHCGRGRVLYNYLKVVENCPECGAQLGHLPADDMPPWLTIILVGHVLAPFLVPLVQHSGLGSVALLAIILPLVVGLTVMLLPRCKGAVLAVLWFQRR